MNMHAKPSKHKHKHAKQAKNQCTRTSDQFENCIQSHVETAFNTHQLKPCRHAINKKPPPLKFYLLGELAPQRVDNRLHAVGVFVWQVDRANDTGRFAAVVAPTRARGAAASTFAHERNKKYAH